MESSVAPPDIFVCLDEDEAYAGTSFSDWQLMAKQLENFKSLKLEDIEPENRVCDICLEPLGSSNDDRPSETPIQLLTCGHVFGHLCLFNWLVTLMPGGKWWSWTAPDGYWPLLSAAAFHVNGDNELREAIRDLHVSTSLGDDVLIRLNRRDYLNRISDDGAIPVQVPRPPLSTQVCNVSCPKCRGKFSIHRCEVPGVKIEARLYFWDQLYEKLGISRSDKEEKSRNDLLRYVQMFQEPEIEIQPKDLRSLTLQVQVLAMRFALRRGKRDLDPQQSYLRDAIFNLGCFGLHEDENCAISYDNRRIPWWCCLVGRIERGLNPIITGDEIDEPAPGGLAEYTQFFGPWKRILFAEVGGWEATPVTFELPFRMAQVISD